MEVKIEQAVIWKKIRKENDETFQCTIQWDPRIFSIEDCSTWRLTLINDNPACDQVLDLLPNSDVEQRGAYSTITLKTDTNTRINHPHEMRALKISSVDSEGNDLFQVFHLSWDSKSKTLSVVV